MWRDCSLSRKKACIITINYLQRVFNILQNICLCYRDRKQEQLVKTNQKQSVCVAVVVMSDNNCPASAQPHCVCMCEHAVRLWALTESKESNCDASFNDSIRFGNNVIIFRRFVIKDTFATFQLLSQITWGVIRAGKWTGHALTSISNYQPEALKKAV